MMLRWNIPEASLNAHDVDFAFLAVLGIALAIFLLLLVLLVTFAIRYRRGSRAYRASLPPLLKREMEIGWTAATTFLAIFIFWWFVGGQVLPPRFAPGQLEIHVIAKQWMWKVQHENGAREIDALHIPAGRQVRLVMNSQDVIHSFFAPAFRLKQDVVPGRSTELVFTPTTPGKYHLLCSEYCGTQHSHMGGQIVVMRPPDYESWLRGQPHSQTAAQQGEALYANLGCGVCHDAGSMVRAPKLAGLYGASVTLRDGAQVRADDAYIARMILHPREQPVAGFAPIMPSYASVADASEVESLVAYIKSLSNRKPSK